MTSPLCSMPSTPVTAWSWRPSTPAWPPSLWQRAVTARLGSLVIVNGFAKFWPSYEDLDRLPPDALETFHKILDGDGAGADVLAFAAPSERDDGRFRAWFDDAGRRGASPTAATQRWSSHESADVTSCLAQVAVPTLVLHREGNLIVSARQAAVLAEGIPGAQLVVLPGHDNLIFAGPVDEVTNAIARFAGRAVDRAVTRVLTTLLFTDIVGSTNRAVELGDRRWTTALDIHDAIAKRILDRHGGTLVNTTGDGLLVTFDGPGDALRCGSNLRDASGGRWHRDPHRRARRRGRTARRRRRRDRGPPGSAVMAMAEGGEVLVSSVVPLLMTGSDTEFQERGEHHFKGIPGTWSLYAANI